MADEDLRRLERRCKETGAIEDESALLAERVRIGDLERDSLRRAAHLGYPAARSASGSGISSDSHNPSEWHVAARSTLARRLLYGDPLPLTPPGSVSLEGLAPGTRGEWFPWCRGVYSDLLDCDGGAFRTVLGPWLLANEGDELIPARLRTRSTPDRPYQITDEESWNLYALGRVNDFLLISFQTDEEHPWSGATVSLSEYWVFFERLGLTLDVFERFHPFHHEIVEVDPSEDPDEPITLVDVLWPGVRFGDLQFSRAGVRVRGGAKALVKEAAERSPIYFTFRRHRRPTRDLSQGWGSNSQWRTGFRRDYEEPDAYYYNVDGRWVIGDKLAEDNEDIEEVPEAERIEVLTHRHVLRIPEGEESDRWPYDDMWVEQK